MPIDDDVTVINDQDSNANTNAWTPDTFGSLNLNNNQSQVPIYREGGGCAEGQIDPDDGRWRQNVSINLTGGIRDNTKCYCIWIFQTAPAAVDGMTNMQVGFRQSNNFTGNGGLWDFKPAFQARDTYGWLPCLVYPTQPSESFGTFSSLNLATISSHAVDINNSSGSEIRLFGIETSFTISYLTGHSQTVTLQDLFDWSSRKGDNQDLGVVFKSGESYQVKVVIRLGDASATTNTTWNESAKVIHFDNFNNDHSIGFNFINHATHTNNFTLSGCFLFWNTNKNGSGVYHDVFVDASNCDTWSVTNTTFLRGGDILLPPHQTGFVTNNNTFNDCGKITPGDTEFKNNTISNYSGTEGAMLLPTSMTNNSANTFISAGTGHAIHITSTGTYSITDFVFSGYSTANGGSNLVSNSGSTDAVFFNDSGGAVTLNVSGGSGVITVRNGAGATTTVNNTVPFDLTNLVAGTTIYVEATAGGALSAGTVMVSAQVIAGTTFSTSLEGNQPFKCLLAKADDEGGDTDYEPILFEDTTGTGFARRIEQIAE